jgi:hypothetical protein
LPIVQTGTTKKITITELTGTQVSAAGEVGIGGDTTGVVAGVTVTSKFCVKNEGANPVAGFVHVNDTTANSGSNTFACRSRGTLAAPTVVQNGDSLWNMYIAGNDGTDLALAAEIRVEVDGVPGSNDMPGRILLRTTPDGSQAPVDAVKIDSAQNVTVSAGNLVIGTSGKGIDFSGVGTAAEILDDYEEGTWTPTVSATVTAPTTPATGVGRYTKIGRLVTVTAEILDINMSGSSGNLRVTDFPFANAGSLYFNAVGSCFFSFINTPAGTQNIVPWIDNNQTQCLFAITADNASYDIVVDNATTQGRIYLTMSYHSV